MTQFLMIFQRKGKRNQIKSGFFSNDIFFCFICPELNCLRFCFDIFTLKEKRNGLFLLCFLFVFAMLFICYEIVSEIVS